MPAHPGDARSLRTLEYVLGADPAVVRGFARAADDDCATGPLTLAARDRLLRRGQQLGLRRFDANLVLAAVEQRHRRAAPVPRFAVPDAPRRRFVWPAAVAVTTLQSLIVAGAWWLVA